MENNMKVLLDNINAALELLHENHIDIKDSENDDFRISSVKYDSEKDEVFFDCELSSF